MGTFTLSYQKIFHEELYQRTFTWFFLCKIILSYTAIHTIVLYSVLCCAFCMKTKFRYCEFVHVILMGDRVISQWRSCTDSLAKPRPVIWTLYKVFMEEYHQDGYNDSKKVLISHPKKYLPVTVSMSRVQTSFSDSDWQTGFLNWRLTSVC